MAASVSEWGSVSGLQLVDLTQGVGVGIDVGAGVGPRERVGVGVWTESEVGDMSGVSSGVDDGKWVATVQAPSSKQASRSSRTGKNGFIVAS